MRRLLPHLKRWRAAGTPCALATVVEASGSSPRPPGSCLAVAAGGQEFAGAVSAGCFENDVLALADGVIETGLLRPHCFGSGALPPWIQGLSCGGQSCVWVEPWSGDPFSERVESLLGGAGGFWRLRSARGHWVGDGSGLLAGDPAALPQGLVESACAAFQAGQSSRLLHAADTPFFLHVVPPLARLVLVGAVDLAVRLVALGRTVGLHCVVVDHRKAYCRPERFDAAPAELWCGPVSAWPGLSCLSERDAAVVLSHDPAMDDPALLSLSASSVGYLGALGSVRSHQQRLSRLEAAGATSAQLAKIEGPAGLKLGKSGDAIAVGILAGVIKGLSRCTA